jgi:hypothetical protein
MGTCEHGSMGRSIHGLTAHVTPTLRAQHATHALDGGTTRAAGAGLGKGHQGGRQGQEGESITCSPAGIQQPGSRHVTAATLPDAANSNRRIQPLNHRRQPSPPPPASSHRLQPPPPDRNRAANHRGHRKCCKGAATQPRGGERARALTHQSESAANRRLSKSQTTHVDLAGASWERSAIIGAQKATEAHPPQDQRESGLGVTG